MDYEKAVVYIGVCNWRQGKKDEGYAQLIDYLENFINDPKNSVTGTKEIKRTDAMATAGFYRCLHEHGKEQWKKVIGSSATYHDDYPDQTSMAPWVMSMVGESYAREGQIEDAKRMLTGLIANYPDSNHVSILSTIIYNVIADARNKATDPDTSRALLEEMANLLALTNDGSGASLTSMRNESKHWIELGDWDKAVVVLERLVAKYGDDPAQEDSMQTYILPDLAHGYLEQQKVEDANAILSNLMISLTTRPSKRTVLNYARSVTGWVTGNAAEIVEVPGAGQTVEAFQEACDKLNALANSVDEKWACDWYNLKFQLAYGYYKWATAEGGPKDDSKKNAAHGQLNALIQPLGSNFKGKDGVPGVGQSCDEDPEWAGELGDDVLRRRLVWLWGKVN